MGESHSGELRAGNSTKRDDPSLSNFLLWAGAAVFLIGGKFLHEIKHGSFLVSETIGILGGVLLMLLGAGIAIAGKSPRGK